MQSKICKQFQKSKKNTEIKYPEGNTVFVSDHYGSLIKFSIIENKPVRSFGKILFDQNITSMAKTLDNKS